MPWLALLWLAGTVGVTVWWAAQPHTGVGDVVLMAPIAGLVLAAATAQRARS